MSKACFSFPLFAVALLFGLFVQDSAIAKDDSGRAETEANVSQSPTLSNPITYEVDFSAIVTAPYHTDVLKIWLPLPQSDSLQQVSNSQLTTFPDRVPPKIGIESVYGNKLAYFEFHKPRGAQIIRHRFKATVRTAHWNLDPSSVAKPSTWPTELAPYLKPDSITEAAGFRSVIDSIASNESTSAHSLFAAMHWIEKNLAYDHVNASLRADAEHAFTKRRGHCSDYHGLCATMGRSLGFPTRVTYGLALFPKNSPSHCKLEAYLPPYDWVSFDLSEPQRMVNAIQSSESLDALTKTNLSLAARRRLTQGFRENSWLLATKGTNYDRVPKASQPVHAVRTIYAEADGEALPEPDPGNKEKREFGWMTVHSYNSNKPVTKPFKDFTSLDVD